MTSCHVLASGDFHHQGPHFQALLPLSRPLQREFYAEMSRVEGWSLRTLRERIDSMLYERTAVSKQPDALMRQELAKLRAGGELSPALILKDQDVLDFLDLSLLPENGDCSKAVSSLSILYCPFLKGSKTA